MLQVSLYDKKASQSILTISAKKRSFLGCKSPGGGYFDTEPDCPNGSQFEPPLPGLVGYGELIEAPGTPTFLFSIGDYLQVYSNEYNPDF